MDFQQLKDDAAAGRLSTEKLLDVIAVQQRRIEELEARLKGKNPTERLAQPYSQKAEEKRRGKAKRRKRGPLRRGRVSTADKAKLADRTEPAYPAGVAAAKCKLSHKRVVWRLEEGRAVLVAYEIYRSRNLYGKPPGVLGKGDFGIEILVALGYQVYCMGLSIDKACQLMSFFQQLNLRKSQADALLNQLAAAWESEFDYLCLLLANSAVVHTDETSWSIKSAWAFLTEKLTVLFYGVNKDGETLAQVLDKNVFQGVLVSDDAAIYQGFSKSQKCWAHLIRKAIKLTLQDPGNGVYRHFADRLMEIYGEAKRVKADQRLLDSTRRSRTAALDDELLDLCAARWLDDDTGGTELENDYRRLCNEIMRLMLSEQLFVFVTEAEVDGTNNVSERQLRDDAMARKTGRTSKTPAGAKRRSVIASTIQSIQKQLGAMTLDKVIEEVNRWLIVGRSCFFEQVESNGRTRPLDPSNQADEKALLDRLIYGSDA